MICLASYPQHATERRESKGGFLHSRQRGCLSVCVCVSVFVGVKLLALSREENGSIPLNRFDRPARRSMLITTAYKTQVAWANLGALHQTCKHSTPSYSY